MPQKHGSIAWILKHPPILFFKVTSTMKAHIPVHKLDHKTLQIKPFVVLQ